MEACIITPSMAEVYGTQEEFISLAKRLSYINEALKFQKKKISENHWWKKTNPEGWQAAMDKIEEDSKGCLLFFNPEMEEAWGVNKFGYGDVAFVRTGSLAYLDDVKIIRNDIKYPKAKGYKMVNPLPFELYSYQKEAVQKLIDVKHGNVSIATGLGKTAILIKLTEHYGLKTVIVTPFASIFRQMLKEFQHHFGKDMVGGYGDGLKQFKKPITITVAKSLTTLEKDAYEKDSYEKELEIYNHFASCEFLGFDESHLTGAATLEKICFNVLKNIPYRVFVSGTQLRNDGKDKVLESIIGKEVIEVSTKFGVDNGYLCNHSFKIVPTAASKNAGVSSDPMTVMREQFLYNENIADWIGNFCNAVVTQRNQKVLILISELSQLYELGKRIKVPFTYATAASKKDMDLIKFPKKDIAEAIEEFDTNKAQVLIGSSCINTGVNIYSAHHTIGWNGTGSEITTRQGVVGRSVRILENSKYKDLNPPKPHVHIWDFQVLGIPLLKSQLMKRIRYYELSGTPIEWL